MAAPGNLNPLFDLVSVSYELINRNTLQPISHSGNYAEVNNSQFIFLKVHPQLTSFDKRAKKVLLTFRQYTNFSYQVYLSESNTAHLISSNQIPLRKYTSNNTICYEADITDFVASHPTREIYFAITTSSNMSFYVNGANNPSASIVSYSVSTGSYSKDYFSRIKSFSMRNYQTNIDLFSLTASHLFSLFSYEDELLSFNLLLVNNFAQRNTSSITNSISTGFPKGFKLNKQQYIYLSGTRSYTYIDENFFLHVFIPCLNDNGSFTHFVDSNGSYLVLEVLSNQYKIYSLDGSIKTFSLSGYLISETVKNGDNVSTIAYAYTNNLLTGVSINNQSFASISYSSSSITITFLNSNNSVTLNFNSDNYLTSLVDQDNVSYLLNYDSDNDGLIDEVAVQNTKKICLLYNEQLMVDNLSIHTFINNSFSWNISYYFEQSSLSTTFYDENLIYVYKFDESGKLVSSFYYNNYQNNILGASSLIENNAKKQVLSTSSPNYLKQITYSGQTLNNFETEAHLTYSIRFLNFSILPKEKGRYFLYFEYLREFISNYQTSNNLTLTLTVGDISQGNIITLFSNRALTIDGFDKLNLFMEEVIIPESHYEEKLNLNFKLSSGETTVTIRNIRLYRLEDSTHYYGINSYTGGSAILGLDYFYSLTDSVPFAVDNISFNLDVTYQDLAASFSSQFFLNKSLLFCDNGKNAYYGVVTKSGSPLSSFKLVDVIYQNKRYSDDEELYDGYEANFISYDSDYYKEEIVQHNFAFNSQTKKENKYNHAHLLVNEKQTIPYEVKTHNNNQYTYYEYYINKTNNYNSYGELINQTLSTSKEDHVSPYFEKGSGINTYSSDKKHLTGVEQRLYNNNSQVNDISSSFNYDSYGDLTSKIDAYNKSESYEYNKFHQLTSLLAYNSGSYHNNNISYNGLLNVSAVSTYGNQGQVTYSYDFKERVANITYDTLSVSYSNISNSESVAFSDGSSTLTLTSSFSDLHLPIEYSINGNTILSYRYFDKNTNFSSSGDSDSDLLGEIRDYKGQSGNTYKLRTYLYNDYGNLLSISENGVTLTISSSYFTELNGTDYGVSGNAIKQANIYQTNSTIFRVENKYSFFEDPFTKHKTITETSTDYVVGITESISTKVNGGPQLTLSIYYNDLIHNQIYISFDYYEDENDKFTSFVKEQNINFGYGPHPIIYSYNDNGNLNSIESTYFGINNSYTYNDFNELSGENSTGFGLISYQYDSHGNITLISRVNSLIMYALSYDNQNRLTSIVKTENNVPTTLECSGYTFGRPTKYKGKDLEWSNLELTQYDNTEFEYDGYGRRISKTSTSRSTSYLYIDNTLLKETISLSGSNHVLRYLYDSSNGIVGFIYNSSVYFYVKDLLNNVIAIYDQDNDLICKYVYDAWGNNKVLNPNGTENTTPSFIGNLNPIRYRSYYYDVETNLYYLKSRYYDPEICRFISMDDVSFLDPNKINGLNLYCYCLNNPICFYDPSGHIAFWIITMIVGACIGIGCALYKDWQDGGIDGSIGIGGYLGYVLGGAAIGAVAGLAASSLLAGSFTASCCQAFAGLKGLAWAYTMGGPSSAILYMANNFFHSFKYNPQWLGYYPPNDGFNGQTQTITLQPGTIIQRIGDASGSFAAPYYSDPMSLSLPYNQMAYMDNPNIYIVNSSFEVISGQATPWFGQYGGGIQYKLPMSILKLLNEGYLSLF